jgi:ribosomal protein L24
MLIARDAKNQKRKVLKIRREKSKVGIEGITIAKKHVRRSHEYPNGTVTERPTPIYLSNMALKSMEGRLPNAKGQNKSISADFFASVFGASALGMSKTYFKK